MKILIRVYHDENVCISDWCYFELTPSLIDTIRLMQEELKKLKQLNSSVYKLALFNSSCSYIDTYEKINEEFEELQENHRDNYFFKIDKDIDCKLVRTEVDCLVIYLDSFRFQAYCKHSNILMYTEEMNLNDLLV
jgi:hypothetical protein